MKFSSFTVYRHVGLLVYRALLQKTQKIPFASKIPKECKIAPIDAHKCIHYKLHTDGVVHMSNGRREICTCTTGVLSTASLVLDTMPEATTSSHPIICQLGHTKSMSCSMDFSFNKRGTGRPTFFFYFFYGIFLSTFSRHLQ